MSSINKIGLSLFSGCGGSSLGYKMAGVDIKYANEFIPAASDTYKKNFPQTYVDTRDIRKVEPKDILETLKIKKSELDFFDGSPPCASFSTSGKREKGWGKIKKYSDSKQRTDDLFFEYIRLLDGIQPKIFIAENVSGLIKGKSKGYFNLFLKEFQKLNYNVKAACLDASYLEVPQMRKRVFFIGVRNDLKKEPIFPSYKARQTTEKVFSKNHFVEDECWKLPKCLIPEISKMKQGDGSKKFFNLYRCPLYKPSFTICATYGKSASVIHPYEDRFLSISELKEICSFPEDFILTGNYYQKAERLGRSVPPKMMYHIVNNLKEKIL